MSGRFDEVPSRREPADFIHDLSDLRPWHEAGWIFTDDGAVTIERQGDRTRVRRARVVHLREE